MKKSILFIAVLFITLRSSGQDIDIEFSSSPVNTGDQSVKSTVLGNVAYGPNRAGTQGCAMSFNHSEAPGAVRLSNMNSFDFTSPFSISIWFRTFNNSFHQYLFTKGNGALSEDFSISIGQGSMTGGVTLPDYMNSTRNQPTQWYHYVMVHEEGSVSIYLNNEFKGKQVINVTTTASDTALIGQNFSGEIDQFKLYTYPLHENQISGLYNASPLCNAVQTSISDNILPGGQFTAHQKDQTIVLSNTTSDEYHCVFTTSMGQVIHDGTVKASGSAELNLSYQGLIIMQAYNGKKLVSAKFR